jgi:hypothetical protein
VLLPPPSLLLLKSLEVRVAAEASPAEAAEGVAAPTLLLLGIGVINIFPAIVSRAQVRVTEHLVGPRDLFEHELRFLLVVRILICQYRGGRGQYRGGLPISEQFNTGGRGFLSEERKEGEGEVRMWK